MLEFASGDHAAFELLLTRHEQGVYRYVLRFISSPSMAEELTQEVFLRVCKVAHKYSKKARFTTWLYTIARNLCIDVLRRQKTRQEVSFSGMKRDAEEGPDLLELLSDKDAVMASSKVLREEFRHTLNDALEVLSEEQREVFVLREFSGLKFREIADLVGVSENTIKSRMRYALESLRGSLAAYKDFSFDTDEAADARHLR